MAHFLIQGSYSPASIKAMIGNPQDRSEAARKLIESAGGKLHHFFFTLGESDYVLICELPNNETVAAVGIAVGGTGAMAKYRTTVLLTPAEAMQAMTKAKSISYAAPANA